MDAKFGQLKNESKSELFSDAQKSANGTTINAFEVSFMKNMELHLKVHLKIYIKMQRKVCLRLH